MDGLRIRRRVVRVREGSARRLRHGAMAWRVQSWSDGQVGTMGGSYAGSDQCGAGDAESIASCQRWSWLSGQSNYYHGSMRQNGTLEQRFMVYAFRMAMTSKEAIADAGFARRSSRKAFMDDMPDIVRNLAAQGRSDCVLRRSALLRAMGDRHCDARRVRRVLAAAWLCAIDEYYEEHADVPTMYLGGWYDSYARNTPDELYVKLSAIKKSPQVLLMGPWTHGAFEVTQLRGC